MIRDEVLVQLVDKAMTDKDFTRKALEDLDGTLKAYGFDLNEEELSAVREFHSEAVRMSPDQLDEELKEAAAGRRSYS